MESLSIPFPPDILLSIIEITNIPTLLSLRLVNKSLFNLIASYESSISQALPRRYWWVVIFGCEPPCRTTKTIKQLLQLQRLGLATEVGVHYKLHQRPYEWVHTYSYPMGSALCRHLEHGLAIYDQYIQVRNGARALKQGNIIFGSFRRVFSTRMQEAIGADCISFIMDLTAADILDYKLLHFFQVLTETYQHCAICHKSNLELDPRAKRAAHGIARKSTGLMSWFTPSGRSNTTDYDVDANNEDLVDALSVNSQNAMDSLFERIYRLPRQRGTLIELPLQICLHMQKVRPKEHSAAEAFLDKARNMGTALKLPGADFSTPLLHADGHFYKNKVLLFAIEDLFLFASAVMPSQKSE